MITLNDTEIRDWDSRINDYTNLDYRFGIIPKYTSKSSYPAIGITTYTTSQYQDWSKKSYVKEASGFITNYRFTFSINEDKDIKFQSILVKLRSNKIGNMIMIDDKEIDYQAQEPNEVREIHTVNNKTYIRYTYSIKSFVGNIITQFWLIDNAIKFATKETKFNVNDIVSLKNDLVNDYLLTDITNNGNFIAVKVKKITDDIIHYEPMIIELTEEQLTWSRTNRIDDIINGNTQSL